VLLEGIRLAGSEAEEHERPDRHLYESEMMPCSVGGLSSEEKEDCLRTCWRITRRSHSYGKPDELLLVKQHLKLVIPGDQGPARPPCCYLALVHAQALRAETRDGRSGPAACRSTCALPATPSTRGRSLIDYLPDCICGKMSPIRNYPPCRNGWRQEAWCCWTGWTRWE
jgi:hypothetical protein